MSRDTLTVVLIAAAWSGVAGAVCAVVAWRVRSASIRWSLGLIAAAAIGGVVAGVVGTSQAMFLSGHDLSVVMIVCAVSGLVSLGCALLLSRVLVRAAQALRELAGRVGGSAAVTDPAEGPRELRAVGEELVHSHVRLQAAQQREQQLERSRRELVAWVSHDLRTPLAGLRAMAEALADGLAEDPQRYHERMLSEVDRMAVMVDDLFELSRIHAGTLQLTLQPVGLRDLVSESIAGATVVAQARRVAVDGSIAPELEVEADPGALSRVIGNLVMNAIRHTPADGVVVVEGRHDGSMVELSVTDACGGIEDADLERVFDVAWRGDQARTPEPYAGAGLGLAIVKGLVEAHRGTVAVANHLGGCRFVVRLPAQP
jgi:signal transduction histidine kinase